jgi:UDP-N-acetylmuramyl pentapeptide phosphotransferase/UDP-N-acetylglucosamine-1-phosphate transferase
VLLLHRNPDVSTWAVLLAVMYPAWETAYSMYRRQFKQKTSSGAPDSVHFHHLILKASESLLGEKARSWQRHGAASATVWALVAICQIGALMTAGTNSAAMLLGLAFALFYVAIYGVIWTKHIAENNEPIYESSETSA